METMPKATSFQAANLIDDFGVWEHSNSRPEDSGYSEFVKPI
jgi:hypothetical protein